MKVVMDADSFIFSTVAKMQYDNPFLEGSKVSNWTMVRESFVKKVEFFKERLHVTDLIMFISGKDNFRYSIYPEYKATRANSERPLNLDKLKDFAEEHLGAIRAHGAEADDFTVDFKLKNPEYVMAAIDKDVKNFVEGKHYDYWKEDYVHTTAETALKWPFIQTLMGDNSDNIIGLHGIGPKKAEKLLSEALEPSQMWDIVVSTYKSHSRSEEEALMNMRLVRMDQFDINTQQLTLWNPPN